MLGELLIDARKLLADIEWRHGSSHHQQHRERQREVDRHHDLEHVEVSANPVECVVVCCCHGADVTKGPDRAEAGPAGALSRPSSIATRLIAKYP
jgi:hypothetical protein